MKTIKRKFIPWALAIVLLGSAAAWFLTPRKPEVAALTLWIALAEWVLAVNGRIRPRLQMDRAALRIASIVC